MTEVRWITAFIDLPAGAFDADVSFWTAVTGTTRSAVRGALGEFVSLLPADGDEFLKAQRLGSGPARVHLDLHVDDPAAAVAAAVDAGGTHVGSPHEGVEEMRSAGGFVLCFVPPRVTSVRPAPGSDGSLVDQVALDVPSASFDAEVGFWSAVTGWAPVTGSRSEFTVLPRPGGMPLRLMLHRLGDGDSRASTSAHLDLACGDAVERIAERHVALGASVVRVEANWITLRDPAGLAYCLTRRDPATGLLPA